MRVSDMRTQSTEALNGELEALLKEQFNLRMQHATQQLKQVHKLRKVRRDIARIKTLLREKVGK